MFQILQEIGLVIAHFISNSHFKFYEFMKKMNTEYSQKKTFSPRLVLTGWSALTRLYFGILELTSSDKILLPKKVQRDIKCHIG